MVIKKPDNFRTAEVFSVLKSVVIPVRKNNFNNERAIYVCSATRAILNHIVLAQVSFQTLLYTGAERDHLLKTAGYPVFRYRTLPDLATLRLVITPDAVIHEKNKV